MEEEEEEETDEDNECINQFGELNNDNDDSDDSSESSNSNDIDYSDPNKCRYIPERETQNMDQPNITLKKNFTNEIHEGFHETYRCSSNVEKWALLNSRPPISQTNRGSLAK